jgi:hypothetical protein
VPKAHDDDLILRAYAITPNAAAVARLLGIGERTVRRKLDSPANRKKLAAIKARFDREGYPAIEEVAQPAPAARAASDPLEEARKSLERSRAFQQERELLYAVAGERSLRETLTKLMHETAKVFPAPPAYVPPRKPSAVTEVGLLHLSDWHAYEEVKRSRTQGLNDYNAEVFARRVKRIIDQVIARKKRMEGGGVWHIPELVIACNGDFVSGTIHDAERHLDAPNVCMAVYGCGMTLAAAVRDLVPHFGRITLMCTSGNHGRLGDQRKTHPKDPTRNWDTLIYLFAEAALRDCKNVRFVIPDSYVVSYNIGSKRFVQYHGHAIKSWNAIPHYGIGRWTRNNQAMRSLTNSPVDYYLMGHFHSDSSLPSPRGKTYINGSLIGGTEYAVEELGACDVPMQRFFLVSDPIGITDEVPIFGEVPGEEGGASYPAYPWERVDADAAR